MIERALDHRFRCRAAEFLEDVLLHRAGVYADADRQTACLCRLHDRLYTVCAADVARIQANLVHAGLDRRQRETVVKVDVRHHRQRRVRADFAQRLRRLHIRHGTANNVAARVRQCANLRQSSLRVARIRVGHGLHRDGRAAANQYVPYLDLLCYFHSSNLSQMENGE